MRKSKGLLITLLVVGLAIVTAWMFRPSKTLAPTNTTATVNQSTNTVSNTNTSLETQVFSTADLPDRDSRFAFRVNIPTAWAADYAPVGKAIRFYDPTVAGALGVHIVVLVKSSLPHPTSETTYVDGMLTSWFDDQIDSVAADLPSWVTTAHREAWVSIKGNTSTYYVFTRSPQLDSTTFDHVVTSLRFSPELSVNPTLSD